MWTSTVVEQHRLRHDLAVVRLVGDVVPFVPGQSVTVQVPQRDRVSRRLSPALPPSLDGKLEFHVRAVPGGWCSGAIVTDTRPGDIWTIYEPRGEMHIDDSGRDVVLVAGGTGLAPLRSLVLDVSRRPRPPLVHLFTGGRSPRDLYAADMLYLLAEELPWLTVVPVVESLTDPSWHDDWYERTRNDVGFAPEDMLVGTLADAVRAYGPFTDHQVLVCGSPAMTRATVDALIATGTPAVDVVHDPL